MNSTTTNRFYHIIICYKVWCVIQIPIEGSKVVNNVIQSAQEDICKKQLFTNTIIHKHNFKQNKNHLLVVRTRSSWSELHCEHVKPASTHPTFSRLSNSACHNNTSPLEVIIHRLSWSCRKSKPIIFSCSFSFDKYSPSWRFRLNVS